MAISMLFVGVDRYQSPKIRDLAGARNDAIALAALFEDTLGIQGTLITGTAATTAAIRSAFEQKLLHAKEEDSVIVFYSGHGSKDHRITAFDTTGEKLNETTITMDEIAELFKKSSAKSIFFILDCCFSGGAPAKVLEDSPVAREIGNPLDLLAGQGKVILAASNFDEPSYELPSTGHGILTKAIIDVLQEWEHESVNLLAAMDKIMGIVRAEAGRIGVEQTPVLLNHVTGGLTLPKLHAGEKYYAAFPDKRGIKVSRNISELGAFGLPEELLTEWSSVYTSGLNDLQIEAINEYRILDGSSLFVIAPTSSGKTFVGELAAARAIASGKKAVFLFPYKALVNEKFDQFTDRYGGLGFRVIRCTGDYLDQNNEFVKGKYDIALFTYEMFLNLSISMPGVLGQIGLIVVDEAQFITDKNRGIAVELLLTNLIAARNRGIAPQIITLSAVVGSSNGFEDWLGCRKLETTKRPVPLVEGVLGRDGRYSFLSEDGKMVTEQLLDPREIIQRRNTAGQQDVIVPLVKKLIAAGEKVIVFRNQKGATEGCAAYLAADLGLPPADDEAKQLPKHMSSSSSPRLRECFGGGAAFHNSNLSREERKIVEKVYRDPKSKIRVLAATTTVAAGINTPASTVILAEHEFIGDDGRMFTIAEYKNMAGRAGRVGFNEKGRSIILADAEHGSDALFVRYVMGKPEPLVSSFDTSLLETWIIRLLAQVKDLHKDDLVTLLANTFGGYVATRRNPEWKKGLQDNINRLYDEMLRLELIEEEGGIVSLTILGKACGESTMSFRSAIRLVELLRSYPKAKLEPHDLMLIVQALPESDEIYTPMVKRGTYESKRVREASSRYGGDVVRILQKYVNGDEYIYYARCKKASLLFDWIHGVSTQEIEDRYKGNNPFSGNITYGNIRSIADFTRFQLRSVDKIAGLIFPGEMLDDTLFESLLKSLESGLPANSHGLLIPGIEMSREECLSLAALGIFTVDDLRLASEDFLKQSLEEATFMRLVDERVKA